MVCLGNLWMVCLGNLWLSKRWSRHRKDGVPRKLVAQYGGLGTGKMVCLGNLWLSNVV